ncbi:MAG: leucyl aminopeptidase [Labrys sp. (in: a-proteobacteria)]
MTHPVPIHFRPVELVQLPHLTGRIVAFADAAGSPSIGLRRLDRLTKGAVLRFLNSEAFGRLKPGEAVELAWPAGLLAEAVQIIRLPRRADLAQARKAGGAIGRALSPAGTTVLVEGHPMAAEIAFGTAMRAYDFSPHKTGEKKEAGPVHFMAANPEALAAAAAPGAAVAEGVFFTRDLVNEPANILTTYDFAARLAAMQELGLDVEILEEEQLAKMGMGALLGVGQGSESPSKVVVMQWHGGEKGAAPFALVGKGVVFDTGGISIKPAAGMEDMKGDMGGAACVVGLMHALAARKAKANVIGAIGLVENMPDGKAYRPGDILTSMSGQTIEVINTDAEGRLVLADVLWYIQDRFKPAFMINLATLTGAILVALAKEYAGLFSNNDDLAGKLAAAGQATGERVWRMPLGPEYDKMIDSKFADMKNTGGRDGGSITAAQFLQRFVNETPWAHIDVAGTAMAAGATDINRSWGPGWGVRLLDRLVRDGYEG